MTISEIAPAAVRLDDRVDAGPEIGPGWHIHQGLQRNGRAAIEVTDDTGELIGLIASTDLAMLSIDAAWRGRSTRPDGTRQWWALAIGHASVGEDDPVVIFTRRVGARGQHAHPSRTLVRPSLWRGLWIAGVPGLHTTITAEQGPEHRIRRLAPAPSSDLR
jgi:hypothetical protein